MAYAMKNTRSAFLIPICFLIFSLPLVTAAIVTKRAQVEPKAAVRQITIISSQDPTTIFRKVESELLGKTSVSVRWPSFIPAWTDKEHPLYVNLLSASKADYNIELGWVEGCIGGNACHYGTVRGSAAPLVENEGVRVPVKLHGGIKGYFIDFRCGAHCDDSAIGWAEGSYHYSISIKAEKKETLIKVADSAIASSRVQSH